MKTQEELLNFFGVELNKIYQIKAENDRGYFKVTRTDLGDIVVRYSADLKIVEKGNGFGFNLLVLQRWNYEECKRPILDKKEKEYLSAVVKPFKERVEYIIKRTSGYKNEYISIQIKNDVAIQYPNFNKNTMYKGMEIGIEYTLEELGL